MDKNTDYLIAAIAESFRKKALGMVTCTDLTSPFKDKTATEFKKYVIIGVNPDAGFGTLTAAPCLGAVLQPLNVKKNSGLVNARTGDRNKPN